ncbi:MAG: GerMN domain-containing protein [Desulfobacterales bacterium]|nr:MAG: GerMN domain-containing protein [Desulfobacterales bacterium]
MGILLLGCAVWAFFQNADSDPARASTREVQQGTDLHRQSQKAVVHLYFADRNNSFLKSEQRIMLQPADPVGFARAIVQSLIKGPQKGLLPTLPPGTELSALYITPDNVCYVDLSEAVRKNHPGGSNSELLTIYSVVNSLILNITEIERVKILIGGNEASTLAGHIDLQYPVKAYMLIVR